MSNLTNTEVPISANSVCVNGQPLVETERGLSPYCNFMKDKIADIIKAEVAWRSEKSPSVLGDRTVSRVLGYSAFMKDEIAALRRMNPGIEHKKAFMIAANSWKITKAPSLTRESQYW